MPAKRKVAMDIAIIGAGMTGLSAGYRLARGGHRITIYEKEPYTGGLASAVPAGSSVVDRFYHHIFVSDSEILTLIDELGLKDSLGWYEPKNAIYLGDSLYPFTSPMDLLLFKPLDLVSRIRMGLLVLSSMSIKDYRPFETVTAKDWITRRAGKNVYEKIWEPLLISKFDTDSDNVSGTWIWNKFKLRGSSRGKNLGKEKLGYLDNGFITILDKLAEQIKKYKGSIRLSCEVISIRKNGDGKLELETTNGVSVHDRVLFTGAPGLLSGICPALPKDYADKLSGAKYKANICLILELKKSLSPYYWITVSQKGFPFVLAIEHTNLVGKDKYDTHIVYLSRYCDTTDPVFSMPEKEIIGMFISGLKRIFPGFDENDIIRATLSKAPFAQPVVTLNYGSRIPAINTPFDGLYLAAMSQIYPEDRGLNYALRLGTKAANEIIGDL